MDNTTLILILVVVAAVVVTLVVLARRRTGTEAVPTQDRSRLGKTSSALGGSLRRAWGGGVSDESWEDVEEALIAADVGLEASAEIVGAVKAARPETTDEARDELARQLNHQLEGRDRSLHLSGEPSVVVVVGVNGTGKTTTIAKLAHRFSREGMSVVLAAADTFRAAAGEQLQTWADRLEVDLVAGQEGGDPASVAFDAISSAEARGADIVIVDTAGRLHGKKNLMDELTKIHRVSAGDRGRVDEVLLVLDATGGQNGLSQVSAFAEAVPVSGIVLTKLDGTAKGGIVFAVERRLEVPVKFVGLGEGLEDLEPFDPNRFVAEVLQES